MTAPSCPSCGGSRVKTLAPGYFRCEAILERQDWDGGLIREECGHEFHMTLSSPEAEDRPLCDCGILAIGRCIECGTWLCGAHGELVNERFLCETHLEQLKAEQDRKAAERRQKAAEERQETQKRANVLRPRYIGLLNELLDGFRVHAGRSESISTFRPRRWRQSSRRIRHGQGWLVAWRGLGGRGGGVAKYWLTRDGTIIQMGGVPDGVPKLHEGDAGSVLLREVCGDLNNVSERWPDADNAVRAARISGNHFRNPGSAGWDRIQSAFDAFEAAVFSLRESR